MERGALAYKGAEGQEAAEAGQLSQQASDGSVTAWDPLSEEVAPTQPCPRLSLTTEPLNPKVCVCDALGNGELCQRFTLK